MVGPTEGPRDRGRENHQHDIKELLENPSYLEVLRGGIRNAQDLQLAFELLSALEPEDGGELVKKANSKSAHEASSFT